MKWHFPEEQTQREKVLVAAPVPQRTLVAAPVTSGDDMLKAAATHMPPALRQQVLALVGQPAAVQRQRLRAMGNYLNDDFLSSLASRM